MRTRLSLLALLAGALFLAGCGGAGPDSGAPLSEPPSSSEGSSVSPSDPPSEKSGGITITGTPMEGVENGCIVMESGNTLYLLLGGDKTLLMSGRPVEVTGNLNPGLMTICQQGTPLQVTAVKAA